MSDKTFKAVCPSCGSSDCKPSLSKDGHSLFKCFLCSLGFVYPMPDLKALKKLYDEHSYHEEDRYDSLNITSVVRKIWQVRLQITEDIGFKGAILDVGCATGIFLNEAKQRGWEIQGLEVSDTAAAQAKRLLGDSAVRVEDLTQFKPEKPFDVLSMWALIEHVTEPNKYLQSANACVKLGGLIMISTPSTDALAAKWRGKAWRYYIPPYHLTYFNKKSLKVLLEKNGFEVIKWKSHFRHLAFFDRNAKISQIYSSNKAFRMFVKFVMIPLKWYSDGTKSGDTLEVYAVKKSTTSIQ